MDNDIKQRIHEYADGSPQLEAFLKTCVFRGVESIACSRGSEEKSPYVFFEYREDYDKRTKDFIHFILRETEGNMYNIETSYSMNNDTLGISVSFPNKEVSNVFYTVFSGIRLPYHVEAPDTLSSFRDLSKILSSYNLNSRLDVVNNEEYLLISTKESNLQYDRNNCYELNEYIDYVAKTSKLVPNVLCHCDVDSINRLSSLLGGPKNDSKSK